ncbi:hypothetical protein L1987_15591 [Smallanthus sonchifolius]|uniref:Uncharacterized protein n=1 Tax=Smallanthus sonchifolius TaxID=185202 RepID=A0ACB9J7I9_9ASTR|nr:hypothetical protein L1987_15591 [Smallanthus sonchifolius]
MKALTLVPSSFSSSSLCFLVLVSSLCSICFCNQNSDPLLCIPTERLALMDLKSNLTDPANRLSSWVGKDCCCWSGVVCDNFTGHVHEIHLRGPDNGIHGHCHRNYLTGNQTITSNQMLGGTISPSVIKLLQLRYLDLSCNDFLLGSIPAFIGSFQNLIYLNLSKSYFFLEIPHQLGNLSTLRVLDLHSNYLDSKSLKWLENLKGLQYLDMSGIYIPEASDWFPVISNLTSLLELHLSDCLLDQLPNNPQQLALRPLLS